MSGFKTHLLHTGGVGFFRSVEVFIGGVLNLAVDASLYRVVDGVEILSSKDFVILRPDIQRVLRT